MRGSDLKLKHYIKNPLKIWLSLASRGVFDFFPDKLFLRLKYRATIGTKLDLDSPRSYNEKLQWLKLYDRNPRYVRLVDKCEVKKWVAEVIGDEYIIPTIGVWNSFDEIDFSILPEKYVLKCTHDSGGVLVVTPESPFSMKKFRDRLQKSLNKNYFWVGREWPYKNVKPRIIAEQYIESDGDLRDYKFMCFHGKVHCVFVCSDRFAESGLKVTFFDREWKVLPFERHYPKDTRDIPRPASLELMIQLAEKLSQGIPFVRVDFYENDNMVLFGEMTFYPGSGFEEFTPVDWDYRLGELIDLKKIDE